MGNKNGAAAVSETRTTLISKLSLYWDSHCFQFWTFLYFFSLLNSMTTPCRRWTRYSASSTLMEVTLSIKTRLWTTGKVLSVRFLLRNSSMLSTLTRTVRSLSKSSSNSGWPWKRQATPKKKSWRSSKISRAARAGVASMTFQRSLTRCPALRITSLELLGGEQS